LSSIPIITTDQKEVVSQMVRSLSDYVNKDSVISYLKPVEIICLTILAVLFAKLVGVFFNYFSNITFKKVKVAAFRFVKTWIPQVRNHIEKEGAKVSEEARKKFHTKRLPTAMRKLPTQALKESDILARISKSAKVSETYYKDQGNVTGAVYIKDDSHWNFISDVMRTTIVSNPLHIDEFIYVTQMEAEIIRWTIDLYRGNDDACGIVTSGGTESIILGMLAYR